MRLELIPEVFESGEHWIWSALTEGAERPFLHHACYVLDHREILDFPRTLGDAGEDFEELLPPDPARRALAARFCYSELQEEPGQFHHARILIYDYHAAGAHERPGCHEGIEVDGQVEHLNGNAATKRATGLNSLELAVFGYSAAYVEDYISQGCTHGNLHEAGVFHLASQGEHRCARAPGSSYAGKPIRPV